MLSHWTDDKPPLPRVQDILLIDRGIGLGLSILLPRGQTTGTQVWRAGPCIRAMISIRVLTEHIFCLVHDVLHLLDKRLSLSGQDEVMLYHVCGNLIWSVPIEVKLEGHHLVVMRLQLTLHHLVPRVTHIQDSEPGPAGPLLPGACTSGPTVVFPGSPSLQPARSKGAFAVVNQISSRGDIRTSQALTALWGARRFVL